jgi:serine/threonine protein kinase
VFISLENGLLKIGDFGLTEDENLNTGAGYAAGQQPRGLFGHNMLSIKKIQPKNLEESYVFDGTPGYTPPEGNLKDVSTDIYAVALIMLELLCPRFTTNMARESALDRFRHEQPPQLPASLSESEYLTPLAELVKEMGSHDPTKRPNVKEISTRMKAFRKKHEATVDTPKGNNKL